MRTVSPGRMAALSIPWRQQARGSVRAASSGSVPAGRTTHWAAGARHWSAKPPSMVTPTASMARHSCFLPWRQEGQVPQ